MKKEILDWLSSYKSKQPNFGLERMQTLLQLRGNPHLKMPIIHIAGTNGKGSTIACLSQLLQAMQLKVGVFSSPYIVHYHDQISVNGRSIDDTHLQSLVNVYRELCNQHAEVLQGLTEFELVTAIAYDYFYQQQVDVAIIEVGMGGLLDSTNVCQPMLTGITTIGLDHVDLLGNTLAKIAEQKAGIMKYCVPIVTGNIEHEALGVIETKAAQLSNLHISWQKDYAGKYVASYEQGELFEFRNVYRTSLFNVSLLGMHQVDNASMAIMLADEFCRIRHLKQLSNRRVQKALTQVSWHGRMEQLSNQPCIVIDGAHNPHAMKRLVENMNKRYNTYRKHIIFSCIQTKDIDTMLNDLHAIEHATIYLTSFDDERSIDTQHVDNLSKQRHIKRVDWKQFLDTITLEDDEMILITGSLYFLSHVRGYVLEEKHG
ncbi:MULTISPECIES: folylpolyglutamate synthase/dihydrofolate synthase family protein [unclassified Granulicatella]|uniref:bifunctional folylpolyglutamate synthase/dihydrofolate synthase n=1 Tax=unclassified Granulicatella TaxID=2630493 RepID=UPI001073B37B|nr:MULTISPECIES: folylpolyglutamate synthase/dihydrofolate synthase family protein [unclassified Granulicatella]MBF0781062.1 bifunctional folylpolyglutamate synthase/dihydrofolate synthase [Granulicatella sp. 19428wC4_WM01]TFU92262.1 bifunctional folylpolyglutamate synthase/dihydrofolate synthase [Granulicatella sp. WM01]